MSIEFDKLSLGEQVRMKRTAERKSQRQLAADLKITQSYLSLYELGRLTMTAEHKAVLQDYLNA